MKHFKAAAVIAAGAIAAAAFPFTVSSEELVEMDYNGDGAVDVADIASIISIMAGETIPF